MGFFTTAVTGVNCE